MRWARLFCAANRPQFLSETMTECELLCTRFRCDASTKVVRSAFCPKERGK